MIIFYSGTGSTNFVETNQSGINIMMTYHDMRKSGPTKRYKAICLYRKRKLKLKKDKKRAS